MSGYCYGCGNQQPPPQLPYSSDGNSPPYSHQLLSLRCALRRTKAAILIHATVCSILRRTGSFFS
ncbi:unnamed protein product [Brassica oleracea]|uniref:Uncharacterized protein n=1 Tax=Brassica oleracea TaxID=3712 RepID=A0A3P6DQH0_BRAOL|nr:unnamed protein product [Brassica oleracea]